MLDFLRRWGLFIVIPVLILFGILFTRFSVEELSGFEPRLHVDACEGATSDDAQMICIAAFYGAATDGCAGEKSRLFENAYGGDLFAETDPRLRIYRTSYKGQRQIATDEDRVFCVELYSELLNWQQQTQCQRHMPVMLSEALAIRYGMVGQPNCAMRPGPGGEMRPVQR